MSLGDILHSVEDALTGSNHEEAPENPDLTADPAYDSEQGIKGSSEDPYGDPADQNGR